VNTRFGGIRFVFPALSPEQLVTPTQVWTQLAADRQVRTVRLLTHLAFNLVATRTAAPKQEPPHVVFAHSRQGPA
jgi:hypothetical protein